MKSDFILNVEISSYKKFSYDEFELFKEEMESRFPFNEFSLILSENSSLEKNGIVEIYIEDLGMEFDLTEDIDHIVNGIEDFIKISKGSKIEWYSSIGFFSCTWEKMSGGWDKTERGGIDFYEESFFDFEE